MPYANKDDKSLPERIKKLSEKIRKAWVDTWNSVFKKTKNEARAFAIANSVINKMKADGKGSFEIQGDCRAVKNLKELTEDDILSYGLTPAFCQGRPNMKVIEGNLFLTDTSFSPCFESEVMKESGIKSVIIPEAVAAKSLWQLQAMPIHINCALDGHKDGDGGYFSIGTILGSKIVKEEDQTWCRVLGSLWEDDYPDQVETISARREEMGMSVEFFFALPSLEMVDEVTAKFDSVAYKGLAILQKNEAAFPQSQLLVASKVDGLANSKGAKMKIKIESDGTPEGTKFLVDGKEITGLKSCSFSFYPEFSENKLSCSYSVSEESQADEWNKTTSFYLSAQKFNEGVLDEVNLVHLRNALARNGITSAEEFQANAQKILIPLGKKPPEIEGGGNMIKLEKDTYAKSEVEVLLAQAKGEEAGEKKHTEAMAAKEVEVATEKARAEKAEGELKAANEKLEAQAKAEKEVAAEAKANDFWVAHEKEYPAENKDEILVILKKVELGTATSAETLKLAELKKGESTLTASKGDNKDAENAKLDKTFGIKSAEKNAS